MALQIKFLFFRLSEFFYNTLTSLLCIILIVGFVLWLNTPKLEVYINDAFLTNLSLKNNTNDTFFISYDMSLNIAVTNPNAFVDIYCDDIEATAFVQGQYQLTKVVLTPFYLKHKTTTTLGVVFQGSHMLSFGSNCENFLCRFGDEMRDGTYNIVVGFSVFVRTKLGKLRINVPYSQPYIYCDLRVPLNSMDGKGMRENAEKR
ncbi:NDR1/HIN1-like protein 10 [Cannabis sativa]|nr:NDR1/HIN1-like protein 10 [Cannabis sativa]